MTSPPALTPEEALRVIQVILGVFILATGLWLLFPWLPIVDLSTWAAVDQAAPIYTIFVSIIFVFTGAGYVRGATKGHNRWTRVAVWTSVGLFAMVLTLRVTTIGLVPILWLYPLVLMLIASAVALTVRVVR